MDTKKVTRNGDFVKGWNIFCSGLYLNDCANAAQMAGFSAAWRAAEGI